MVMFMQKTTLMLREDVHEILKKIGKRKMSEKVNEILFKELVKGKKSMFGIDKGTKSFQREHKDRF